MRKSSALKQHYRPSTSRPRLSVASFRAQMTDYARGDVLRELRGGLNPRKSREAVAHDIGVSAKTVYTWEKRNGGIEWKHAQALGRYYNVDPEALVTRDPEAAGPPTRVEFRDNIEEFRANVEEFRQHVDTLDAKLDLILSLLGEEALQAGGRALTEIDPAEASALAALAKARAGRGPRRRAG